ncbi:MAG: tetratricopeptide repeat protein [Pseudomonadota bacterium]
MSAQLEKFQKFLEMDPENLNLAVAAIDEALHVGEFDVASAILDKQISTHQAQDMLILRTIMLSYLRDGEQETLKKLEGLDNLAGNDSRTRDYYLAQHYLSNENFSGAVERLLPYAFVAEPSREILTQLAEAAKRQGDLFLAIRAHEFSNEKLGSEPASFSEIALLQFELNEMTKAENNARAALETSPGDAQAKFVLGSCAVANGEIDVATPLLNDAATAFPNSGRPVAALGMVALSQHDYIGGAQKLEQAIALDSEHLGMRVALAWCYLLQQDAESAINAMHAANEIDGNFAECRGTLAVAYLFNEEEDKAREEITIANRLNRNNFSGRFAQALIIAKGDTARYEKIIGAILDQPIGPEDKPLREMIFGAAVTRH